MNHRTTIRIFLSRWLGIGHVFAGHEQCHLCARDAWEIDHQLRRVWPAGCICVDQRDCQAERDGVRLEVFLELCLAGAAG